MTTVAVSILHPHMPLSVSGRHLEIYRFGDVVKLEISTEEQSIQLALSAVDALAAAVQLIDAARSITDQINK